MLSNRTWLAVLAAATTVFSSISADYWNNGRENCGTPCCDPCDSGTFGIRADFLYWQAREEGLEVFAVQPQLPDPVPGVDTVPFERSDFISFPKKSKWSPGFRVGLDYVAPCNGWEAALLWTHFNTTAKRNLFLDFTGDPAGAATVLVPVFTPTIDASNDIGFLNGVGIGAFGDVFTIAASSSWKLNYNVVDFTFGKDYCINSCAHLKPYFGARGAWINQKYSRDLLLVGENFTSPTVPPASDLWSVYGDSKFSAGGIVAGTDASLTLGGGFGLYGNFLGSLVYGKYRVRELISDTVLAPAIPTDAFNPVITSLSRESFKVRANLEAGAGIQYLYNIPCSTQSLLVRVGYELVYWFGQNQFRARVPVNESQNSDLWFQGLTVTAKYNF